jgi:hypothetical protein
MAGGRVAHRAYGFAAMPVVDKEGSCKSLRAATLRRSKNEASGIPPMRNHHDRHSNIRQGIRFTGQG